MLKYPSIENSYREKFIQIIRETDSAKDEWWAWSKIHGSNFFIWYNGLELKYGKRSGFIPDDENFYNHLEVMPKYAECVKDLYHSVLNLDGQELTVYGEIFGQGVQKGINYGPRQFRFFDVSIDDKFVDQDRLFDFELRDLRVVPFIWKGSFEEALNLNCEYDSKILGIPNNTEEGLVLKPNKTAFLEQTGTRIILKKKSEKFKEKDEKPKKLQSEQQELPTLLVGHMTENRVQAAISKFGPDFKNFSQIKNEFIRDVIEEAQKDCGQKFDPKMLEKKASEMVRNSLKVLV